MLVFLFISAWNAGDTGGAIFITHPWLPELFKNRPHCERLGAHRREKTGHSEKTPGFRHSDNVGIVIYFQDRIVYELEWNREVVLYSRY